MITGVHTRTRGGTLSTSKPLLSRRTDSTVEDSGAGMTGLRGGSDARVYGSRLTGGDSALVPG